MLIKICGITRVEDAQAAVRGGAHAIGFVFWPGSPRFIDPFRARQIAATLPPFVTPVGVFVNQATDYVNEVAAVARLGAVQLHGDEDPSLAAKVSRPVIKAVSPADREFLDARPQNVMLLFDACDPVRHGGTGKAADWTAASEVARARPLLLAGGLHAGNIAEAVAKVRPFGVDVSSGVESSPGIKDHARLAALFEAVQRL